MGVTKHQTVSNRTSWEPLEGDLPAPSPPLSDGAERVPVPGKAAVGEDPEGHQARVSFATQAMGLFPCATETCESLGGSQYLPREYPPGVLHHEPVQKRRVEAQGVDHAGNHGSQVSVAESPVGGQLQAGTHVVADQ